MSRDPMARSAATPSTSKQQSLSPDVERARAAGQAASARRTMEQPATQPACLAPAEVEALRDDLKNNVLSGPSRQILRRVVG